MSFGIYTPPFSIEINLIKSISYIRVYHAIGSIQKTKHAVQNALYHGARIKNPSTGLTGFASIWAFLGYGRSACHSLLS
jgi:hypothetical protein